MGIVYQDRPFWRWTSTLLLLIVLVLGAVQAGAGQLGSAVQHDDSHESRLHEEEPGTTDGNRSSGKRQIFHEGKPKEEKVDDAGVAEPRRVLKNSPNNSNTSDPEMPSTHPDPSISLETPTPPTPPSPPVPGNSGGPPVVIPIPPNGSSNDPSLHPDDPSLTFDSSCTAPDLDVPPSEDCTIREGMKVVAYLNKLRAQNGLPPLETSVNLQRAVRLQLLMLIGCDVCNNKASQCIGNCSSHERNPSCRRACETDYELCKRTECSPLFYLDCCSCRAPAESFAGRHLLDDPNNHCNSVASSLPWQSAPKTAKDIDSKSKAAADKNYNCAACATAKKKDKVDGLYIFVTLCKFCRKCPGAKRPTIS